MTMSWSKLVATLKTVQSFECFEYPKLSVGSLSDLNYTFSEFNRFCRSVIIRTRII